VDATEDKLRRAAALMRKALTESTGLKGLPQQIVVYWTLGTHSLQHAKTFPLLAIAGKMGTGKSQALRVIENFAYRPVRLSLRGMTTPTIRDKFAESYNGTAIVEEADFAWKDPDTSFEALLSDRYQRSSAEAAYKVKSGIKPGRQRRSHILERLSFIGDFLSEMPPWTAGLCLLELGQTTRDNIGNSRPKTLGTLKGET
jgi:hypothetical protein